MAHSHQCQQDELYASERTIPRRHYGREFSSREGIQDYVDSMRETHYWRMNFPEVRAVDVQLAGQGGSVGGFDLPEEGRGRIKMGPDHRNELIVCHEVAHVLAAARYGSGCGHSPWFVRIYLSLVNAMMGTDQYMALYEAFDRDGIDSEIDESPNGAIVVSDNGEALRL